MISILGAGRAGTALARAAASAHIDVQIASTRTPAQMKYHLAQYAPAARAVPAEQIADGAEVVVLMVPQEELDTVDPAWLAGALVVDATNRWEDEPLPGWFDEALAAGLSSSEAIAGYLRGARVVKALNHISHWDLDADRSAKASAQRALGVAGDGDVEPVIELIRALGFAPVHLGGLAAGRVLEPGGPVFSRVLDAAELRSAADRKNP